MVYCTTLYLNGVRDLSHHILQILSVPHLQTLTAPRFATQRDIDSRFGLQVEVNEINRMVCCSIRYLKRCSWYRPPYVANYDRPALSKAKRYRVAPGWQSRSPWDDRMVYCAILYLKRCSWYRPPYICKFCPLLTSKLWPPRALQRKEISTRPLVSK